MHSLPLFTSVSDQHCVVVGGGTVAHRRVTTLLAAGARVTIVSPDPVESENVSSPAVVVIGSVVSLHDKLAWHAQTEEPSHQSALLAASNISEGMTSAAPM